MNAAGGSMPNSAEATSGPAGGELTLKKPDEEKKEEKE